MECAAPSSFLESLPLKSPQHRRTRLPRPRDVQPRQRPTGIVRESSGAPFLPRRLVRKSPSPIGLPMRMPDPKLAETAARESPLVVRRESLGDLTPKSITLRTANGPRCMSWRRVSPSRSSEIRLGRASESPELVDGEDVGMIESRRRLRLLFEAVQPVRVLRYEGWQHLDRDFAFQHRSRPR
jgi:hypothetical protein